MGFQIVDLISNPQAIVTGGLNPLGAYSNATAYSKGDCVSYNGSSYVAIAATTGNLPTNTTYWQLLAQGVTGAGSGNVIKATNAAASGILQVSAGADMSIGDYAGGAGLVKAAANGVVSAAAAGTDYAPATSGTSALKGNGSGGFSNATLNDVGAPTADFSMSSHKLVSLLDPTLAQDAATKNYVDTGLAGRVSKSGDTMTGTLNSQTVIPTANASYDSGASSAYWANLYASRHYFNSTAYLDGAIAGAINVTGSIYFGSSNYFLKQTGSQLWMGNGADNLSLKLSYGGASGQLIIDQFGQGTVATFTNGGLTMNGLVSMNDGKNIAAGTTTGTKIGTATNQKLGFFNVTPIVQPNTTGTTLGFTAGAGSAVDSAATFTGNTGTTAYTIGDIVKALKSLGFLAA